jgi:hypothetical protein
MTGDYPGAIRDLEQALALFADPDVLRSYDADLDAAFELARADGDLNPLLETVRRWWFEADTWRDPAARRDFHTRVSHYLTEGPPPATARVSRAELRERYGI